MSDIRFRKVWSLTTGKVIDDADVDSTSGELLHRALKVPDNIRVEVTLRDALTMFERHGPDVAEIFSQPRVCQEATKGSYEGMELRPGWSLDLTTADPKTGKRWDLSVPEVQDRVRQLVRKTQPYCVIGSPPCTPFSPLQEISRAKRDPKIMARAIGQ